jgi:ATP-dependent RNA helicase DDX56/DBP9
MVVIDEADLILSFGYEEAVQNISTYFPKLLQSFLMSATLSSEIDGLKKLILHTPVSIE